VLLGEEYHLGGAEDTRRMAEALHLTADDRVLDLACYTGGPARHLARDYGCRVVGVDFSADCIAIAEALTRFGGLEGRVSFHCCDAEAVPEPDGSFTVAWSQCSFPSDLHWLAEARRLLAPGGRVAFTGLIRRSPASEQGLLSLEEAAERVRGFGFRVTGVEDISELDLTYGWVPSMEKLRCREQHYRTRFGEAWVQKAYATSCTMGRTARTRTNCSSSATCAGSGWLRWAAEGGSAASPSPSTAPSPPASISRMRR
jgi:ubiquinone/menaquinone biosynthesis C-methylase UbiE